MAHRSARCTAAATVAVSLLAAGCSSSPADEPSDQPTIDSFEPTDEDTPSATPTPSVTGSEDPFAVPDDPADIDVAYVQRVLEDAIYPVLDETVRLEVEAAAEGATEPPRRVFELIDTVYDGGARTFMYDDVSSRWEGGRPNMRFAADPGRAIVETTDLLIIEPDCIMTTYTRDVSAWLDGGGEVYEFIAMLVPKPLDADPNERNPSPWVIADEGLLSSVEGEPTC